jgi:hypothetical protein
MTSIQNTAFCRKLLFCVLFVCWCVLHYCCRVPISVNIHITLYTTSNVYCLCVNVWCTAATGCQPNCCKIYISYQIRKPTTQSTTTVKISYFWGSPDPLGPAGLRGWLGPCLCYRYYTLEQDGDNQLWQNCSTNSGIVISVPEELQPFLRLPFKSHQ